MLKIQNKVDELEGKYSSELSYEEKSKLIRELTTYICDQIEIAKNFETKEEKDSVLLEMASVKNNTELFEVYFKELKSDLKGSKKEVTLWTKNRKSWDCHLENIETLLWIVDEVQDMEFY